MVGLEGLAPRSAASSSLVPRLVEAEAERLDRAGRAHAGSWRRWSSSRSPPDSDTPSGTSDEQLALDRRLRSGCRMPSIHSSRLRRLVGRPVDARVGVIAVARPSVNSSTWPGGRRRMPRKKRARRRVRSARSSTGAGSPRRARRRRDRSRAPPWPRSRTPAWSPRTAYTTGLTPSGSRTTNSLRRRRSNNAKAKMPLSSGRELDALVLVEVGEDLGVAVRCCSVWPRASSCSRSSG